MDTTGRRVLIGLGVGMMAMVVCAGLMFLLLIFRRRYLEKDDKYLRRMAMAFDGLHAAGDNMDMTRTMAWSPRHRSGLAEIPYDPTLRPLHGQNDPFFHRDHLTDSVGYSPSGTPRNTHSSGHSTGRIAVVPFRESNLPVANTSYSEGFVGST